MEKLTPIKLPDALEQEAYEEKERATQEQIAQYRKNNTLSFHLIAFLRDFDNRLGDFNHYMQMYTPYHTISRTIKGIIRNRLREIQEYYHSFSGANPYALICELEAKEDTEAVELSIMHKKLCDSLNKLNNNIACISQKHVIYVKQPQDREFDWT